MTTTDLRHDGPDPEPAAGVSRRSLLSRSAAGGLGLVLSGSVPGLFGTGVAEARHGERRTRLRAARPRPRRHPLAARGLHLHDRRPVGRDDARQRRADARRSRRHGRASCAAAATAACSSTTTRSAAARRTASRRSTGFVYDAPARGGTTNIEVDRRGNRVREYVSLAGTHNNCAGGRTPWETWITCEETEAILAKPHGYCFEVDPYDQDANRDPQPIKCLGRFAHESIVVDPWRHTIYLTEDAGNPNGLLYRWTPPRRALPLRGGSLQRLAADAGTLEALRAFTQDGEFVPDLSVATEPGTTLPRALGRRCPTATR